MSTYHLSHLHQSYSTDVDYGSPPPTQYDPGPPPDQAEYSLYTESASPSYDAQAAVWPALPDPSKTPRYDYPAEEYTKSPRPSSPDSCTTTSTVDYRTPEDHHHHHYCTTEYTSSPPPDSQYAQVTYPKPWQQPAAPPDQSSYHNSSYPQQDYYAGQPTSSNGPQDTPPPYDPEYYMHSHKYCCSPGRRSPQKFGNSGKRIGRPRIDRSNTRCERCGTASTPQWRYLPTTTLAPSTTTIVRRSGGEVVELVHTIDDRRLAEMPPVIDLSKASKICLCNACWLRVHKSRQRRSFHSHLEYGTIHPGTETHHYMKPPPPTLHNTTPQYHQEVQPPAAFHHHHHHHHLTHHVPPAQQDHSYHGGEHLGPPPPPPQPAMMNYAPQEVVTDGVDTSAAYSTGPPHNFLEVAAAYDIQG